MSEFDSAMDMMSGSESFYDYSDYSVAEYTVEEAREELANIVRWFREQSWHEVAMKTCIEYGRLLPLTVANDAECFFVPENLMDYEIPDWMKSTTLGFWRAGSLVQSGRLVYPLKDVKGQIMGFCGWDKFVEPKYLDSKNFGYKAKATTLYGMEKLPEYYSSKEPVYVVEGIVCCLWLRSQGFQSLALLGSNFTPYVEEILKRFGSRLVLIPDNDEAGNSLVHKAKWRLKKCIIVQPAYGKDIDGCRKVDEGIYAEDLKKELLSLNNPFAKTKLLIRR